MWYLLYGWCQWCNKKTSLLRLDEDATFIWSIKSSVTIDKNLEYIIKQIMKRKYTTFLLCVLVHIARVVEAKSSKKGVCIPPGEKFHCGDLAALHNVRWPRHVAAPHVARHVSSWWYNWHVTPNHEMEPPEDFCTCDTGTCGPLPEGERQEGQSCAAENPLSV